MSDTKPMRIMFLYMFPLWGNGSGAWLRALVSVLVKKGHKVAIVSPDERKVPGVKHYVVKPSEMGVFMGNPELPGARKYEDMNGVDMSRIYTSYIDTVIPAVKDFSPEILHCFHTAFLPPVARIAKIFYGIRYIVTTHGSDLHYLSRDRRMMGLIRDALRVSVAITANSNFTRSWFLDMFGHEFDRKTRTIPGGVFIDDFDCTQNMESEIDREYGLTGKKVVLFTGRLTAHKGVDFLVKAAKQIKGEVLILGDGPERPYLEKLISEYKLTNTRILGYMSPKESKHFHAFYCRADVYVAPSTWNEPLGLVILEAMAARTPVIVTRTGGVQTLVKEGVTGYFVRSRNATQIAERVNFLLEHDDIRKKMSDNAYKVVLEKFTWEKVADQFLRMYEKNRSSTVEYIRLVKSTPKKNVK